MTLVDKRVEVWSQITRADGTVEEPKLVAVSDPRPGYEEAARAAGATGTIKIEEEPTCES